MARRTTGTATTAVKKNYSTTRTLGSAPRSALTLAEVRTVRREIFAAAARSGATNLRIFGSVARGEAGPNSDLDVLVDLQPGRSLLDLGSFLMDLQDLVGRKVDVVTEDSLHWYIRDRILQEAEPL
jgi:predicted nucleotidyltransferase